MRGGQEGIEGHLTDLTDSETDKNARRRRLRLCCSETQCVPMKQSLTKTHTEDIHVYAAGTERDKFIGAKENDKVSGQCDCCMVVLRSV